MPRGSGKAQVRRWQAAIGTVVGLGAVAGVAVLVLPHHPATASRPVADSCGLVRCQAVLPTSAGQGTSGVGSSRPHPRQSSAARPSPSGSPKKTSSTPPGQVASPDVTVSYTLQNHEHGQGNRFQALLTLANRGAAPVPNWTLRLSFNADTVAWVGLGSGNSVPFNAWTYNSGTLTLTAGDAGETLSPGGTEQIEIQAEGSTRTPTSCAFDGAACVG